MFAKQILLSDEFLDMKKSARCLYVTMAMMADDDGFVNNVKSILRQCGCSGADLKTLEEKKLVLRFPSGVAVIRHWKIHNYVRKDTYTATRCSQEKAMLDLCEGVYEWASCDSAVDGAVTAASTQDRLGKDRSGKDRIDQERTGQKEKEDGEEEEGGYPPLPGVTPGNRLNPEQFVRYYSEKGRNAKGVGWFEV